MASSSNIGIIVRSCGIIVGTTRVNRMIDFCNLLRVLSDIAGLDLNLYSLKVSSVYTNGSVSSRIPINNNGDLGFFFHPNAGFNSVELLVESEILVNTQAPNNAGKNHKTVIGDLSVDRFWAGDPYNSEPSDNGTSDEGLFDGDEEQMPTIPNLLTTPCFESSYEDVRIGSIPNSSGCPIYNADNGVLKIGMVFRDKQHLQSAIKDHSVRFARREYKVVGNSRANWKIVCKQNPANEIGYCTKHKHCQWCLVANFTKTRDHWVIIQLGPPHSCFENLCKNLLAADLESKVRIEPTYEVKFVMEHALKRYNYTLSYEKAWQMLKRAREKVFGTWESSCRYLPKFMEALQKYNPGTIVKWRHKNGNGNDGLVHTLGYVFWAFKPCVEAFRHCRKILTVDGTYLRTKYKHRLLIANTIDADLKIISVAYAIVDEENFQSWYWFLQMLATHVVRDVDGVCLISDRDKSILKAIENVPTFGVHRYCLRHIASDCHTQFKSVGLKELCYKAGKSSTFRDFESTMDEIERLNHDAYLYLRSIDPRKWTFCHDGGYRFGVMTTNLSETINGVLKGIRRLPISTLVKATFTQTKNAFLKRGEEAIKLQRRNQSWPENILYWLDTHRQEGMKHRVELYNYSRQTASVTTYHQRVFTVSLTEQECSCGQWKMDRIPCPHAMEVCRQYGVNPGMYVPYCYSTNAYVMTYSSGVFVALPEEEEWDEACFQMKHNSDCRVRSRSRGRDVMSEIQVQDKVGPSHQGCTSRCG